MTSRHDGAAAGRMHNYISKTAVASKHLGMSRVAVFGLKS